MKVEAFQVIAKENPFDLPNGARITKLEPRGDGTWLVEYYVTDKAWREYRKR